MAGTRDERRTKRGDFSLSRGAGEGRGGGHPTFRVAAFSHFRAAGDTFASSFSHTAL